MHQTYIYGHILPGFFVEFDVGSEGVAHAGVTQPRPLQPLPLLTRRHIPHLLLLLQPYHTLGQSLGYEGPEESPGVSSNQHRGDKGGGKAFALTIRWDPLSYEPVSHNASLFLSYVYTDPARLHRWYFIPR